MYDGLLAFALASLLIELVPGPNMTYLALIAASDGRRPGVAAVAGVALGLALMGAAAALGLAGLLKDHGALYQGLKWAGAAYLLWLAWQGWKGGDEAVEHAALGSSLSKFFRRGLITNLLNPKAAIFYVTVMPGFLSDGASLAEPLALSAVYVSVATGVHLVVIGAAGSAHAWVSDPTRTTPMRKLLALSLVLVAAWILVKA